MLQRMSGVATVAVVVMICYCVPNTVLAFMQGEGATMYCPASHVVKEETRILEMPVVEVDTKPLTVVSLYTTIYSTATTLTATTYLIRTLTIRSPNVQVSIPSLAYLFSRC